MQSYWFKQEMSGSGLPEAVRSTVEALKAEQERLMSDYRRYAVLYLDKDMVGFEPDDWRQSYTDVIPHVSYNCVRSVIDALTSRVTARTPSPKFLTSGGTEDLQEKARKMEKLVRGVIDAEDGDKKAELAFRDACIYGIGLLKVFPDNGRVGIEKVHPSRVIVDSNSALNSEPASMFQREWYSRERLASLFPKKTGQIMDAQGKTLGGRGHAVRDLVEVHEAWHLPCGNEPGRHCIVIENAVLLDEEWTGEKFPFVVIRFSDDLMGWHGSGLAEILEGIQIEINELARKIQRNMHLLAVPYILKHKSSDVVDEHLLNNDEFRLIEYVGDVPPRVETPPAVHPQVFQHLEALWNKAFEISGLSQLAANSMKPPGLNSGIALRTFHDIETVRFATVAKQWESLFVDLAELIVECAKQMAKSDGEFKQIVRGDDFVETVGLEADEIGEDEIYVLDVHPASSLPMTPSGRLERVVEMTQAQMISPEEARALLDFPDLEKINRLKNASYEDLEKTFEHMLSDKGDYIEPLPYQDLRTGLKLGTSYYLRARMDGISQKKLDRIARWLEEAADMLAPPEPPPAPEMLGGEAVPPAGMLSPEEVPPPGIAPPGMGPLPPPEGISPEGLPE